MKIYIPFNRNLKKRDIILIIFIVLFILFFCFLRSKINSETNQIYLQKVINDDVYLKNKYGHISGYWVKKVGRAFGPVVGESSEIKHYDNYDIYVNGEKNNGLITVSLYKTKQGDIVKSTVAVEGSIHEYSGK